MSEKGIKELNKQFDGVVIQPQEGKQEMFLSSPVDVAIYGGSAGGGKTWALLMEFSHYINQPGYNSVIFRKNSNQIRNPQGLWDQALKIYSKYSPKPNFRETILQIDFPHSRLKFAHLDKEKSVYNWQGSEICFLGFDELTHFSRDQFFYLFSRNRSLCGVRPYIRATCNADADSWVKESFIEWYLDQNGEYADETKTGAIRYFIVVNDTIKWGNTAEELEKAYPGSMPLSFTFINSNVFDNKILMDSDPKYLSNLDALPLVERERLKKGNWKIKPTGGLVFKTEWFEIINTPPKVFKRMVRYWDRASTVPSKKNTDPDYTAGVCMAEGFDGMYYVLDVARFRESHHKVKINIKNKASQDNSSQICYGGLEQEPGASGKAEVKDLIKFLSGYHFKAYQVTGDKVTRAMPVSAQSEAGNVKIVKGKWNDDFLTELENFDGSDSGHDDQVDGFSGAFYMLTRANKIQTWESTSQVRPIDKKMDKESADQRIKERIMQKKNNRSNGSVW